MKKLYTVSIQFLLFLMITNSLFAQEINYWSKSDDSRVNKELISAPTMPKIYEIYQLDNAAFRSRMVNIPSEITVYAANSSAIIAFPVMNGKIERFRIVEAPVMHPDLAARYPGINSYAGKGIDNPSSTIRFDVSPQGTNAMIMAADKSTIYIDHIEGDFYRISSRADLNAHSEFHCGTDYFQDNQLGLTSKPTDATQSKLRTYRLALLSGAEWSATFFGTATTDAQKKANVLAEQNREMTRANGIFERDFAVRLVLVPTNDSIIYLNSATDPIANVSSPTGTACQSAINAKIGATNYDIGHTESRATAGQSNGVAGCIGCVCGSSTSGTGKGTGFTAYDNPTALDLYVVDYLTHEMGHQMGAYHTFSYATEGTGVNIEPGSGITIMGYAGITGSTDIATHSIDNFHSKSIQNVTTFMYTTNLSTPSSTCGVVVIPNTNAIPTVNAGANYIIPRSTPFALTGIATDGDITDTLSYSWEQIDDKTDANNSSVPTATFTTGPAFRPYSPTRSKIRIIPQIQYILSGANTTKWEVLPSVARTLNFRCLVRDNHVSCGGNNHDDMIVTVNGTAGPFKVTTSNTTGTSWQAGTAQTIAWDVSSSNLTPVNCAKVKISLSTDGGYTFPIVLADSTLNDGTETITVPNNPTTTGRIKVEAVGNIFFDINDKNITIIAISSGFTFNTPLSANANCGSTTTVSTQLTSNSIGGFATPINLTATGNPAGTTVSFSTNPLTPGNATTVTLNNVNTLAQGTYNITVTGTAGIYSQTAVATFIVVPSAGPSISTQPTDASVCLGDPATFTTGSLASGVTYQWQESTDAGSTFNNVSSGGNNATYTISSTSSNQNSYKYRAIISSFCGNTNSNAATLNIKADAVITSDPANATVCPGTSNTFSIVVSGTGLTYQWQVSFDGGNSFNDLQGETGLNYTLSGITLGQNNNQYRVIILGACQGTFASGSATLIVGSGSNTATTQVACGSYTWTANSTTYTTSGNYTYSYTVGGCLSVDTLHLTITSGTNSGTTISSCNSYAWNGTTYTTSGNYIHSNTGACPTIDTLHLTIKQPTSSSSSQSACTSYAWHGTTYTTSGTKTWTGTNAAGCDSVVTLNLTIKQPTSSTDAPASGCGSYSWHGTTYTTSGTKTWTGTNAAGCDSVVSIVLTINPISNTSITRSACIAYTWTANSQTYSTGGTYTNANGCSTDTLHLTIKQSTSSSSSQSTCSSYTWNGTTYTTSGVKTWTGTNAAGCDSVVTLNLTIKQPTTSTQSASACLTYTWNTFTYTTSGVKTWTGANAAGCDSTATLNLTIKQATSSTATPVSACGTYTWNSTAYTTSGVKTFITTNAAGCDSVVTINITINSITNTATTQSVCSAYTWSANAQTYSTSGTYTNVNGCSTDTLHLTIKQTTSSTDAPAAACGSYLWHGTTYTTSGVKTWTGTNAAGCDSVVSIVLTINPIANTSITRSACISYTWTANSQTYSTGGTYTNANGCSTDTLHLTIKQPTTSSSSQSACSSYTWNGTTYTTSGAKVWTGTNAAGCDSVATLNLTIKQPTSSTDAPASGCGSYLWHGTTYTTGGTKTWTGTNAAGCDSVVTIVLTINPISNTSITRSACIFYTWSANGQTYSTGGTYTNPNGCSTDTLHLTIKQPTTSSSSQSACSSYTWNGTTYTTSGAKVWTGTNAAGCDSVATLNLTIKQPTSSTDAPDSACGSYVWHGTTYTTSGVKTWTGTNAAGCDSVVTITITIKQLTSSTTSVVLCSNLLPYTWNGSTYTIAGTYSWTGTNAAGCDSTAALILTTSQPVTPTFSQLATVCKGSTFVLPSTSLNNITGTWSPVINNQDTATYTFNPASGSCVSSTIVTMTVNVDSCIISDGLIIYPNPTTNGKVTINWANANIKIGTKVQVVVYDRIGKVVSKIPLTVFSTVEQNIDLKINGYSNGLYVVSIEVLYTKYKYSTKIIKQTK